MILPCRRYSSLLTKGLAAVGALAFLLNASGAVQAQDPADAIVAQCGATTGEYAAAAQGACNFVAQGGEEVLSILLAMESQSGDAHDSAHQQFKDFVDRVAASRSIARFVLGRYARAANDDQLGQFICTFTEYTAAFYESALSPYAGRQLTVTEVAYDTTLRDFRVTSFIARPDREPLELRWRLIARQNDTGAFDFRVVDFRVAGVWVAIEQRSQPYH